MKNIIKLLIVIIKLQCLAQGQNLDLNNLRIAQRQASRLNNTKPSISKVNKDTEQFIVDMSVDPEKYFVGPGDQFHINIISSNETFDHNLIISPTGKLLIPSVGIINCNGLSLSQLIKEINTTIKSWNKNVKINIALDGIRQFRVLVTGQFINAGYFIVTPMTRVSDLYSQIVSDYNQKKKDTYKEKSEASYSETFGMRSRIAVDDFYQRKLGLSEVMENEIELLSNEIISRSETSTREAIKKLTGGTFVGDCTFDVPGGEVVKLVTSVTIDNEKGSVEIDFAGSSPPSSSGINVVMAYTHAYSTFAVKSIINPELPNNAGSLAPIEVVAPDSCIINAKYHSSSL